MVARLKENKKKKKLTPSTKREPRRPPLDINVRRQLVKRQRKKNKKLKSIKRFMTPLSIPLAAAAMSVGAIQMGETSDKARAEEDGGGVGVW